MTGKIQYNFTATTWQYEQPGGWHFVTIPKEIGNEIRTQLGWQEQGWGRMPATARVGSSVWDTAIWYDTKKQAYLLPLKAEVRKKEQLVPGTQTEITIWI
jgi:hypothetical protein